MSIERNEKGQFIKGATSPYKGISMEERHGEDKTKEIKKKISDKLIGKHSNPASEFTSENTKGKNNPFYGRRHTEEAKLKCRLANLGKKESEETRRKKGEKSKEMWSNPKFKKKMMETHLSDLNIRYSKKKQERIDFHDNLIKKELTKLEKQGFRCVNVGTTKVKKPDIIAFKNNKIYAVEVETQSHKIPNYDKWNGTNIFDDIIWIVKRKNER